MLLHFASSDVSSLPLIYPRQMRQEYLQELYHFSLSVAAAKSTVRWCVSGPAVQRLLKSSSAPGETNKLYSIALTRLLNCAPWLIQIKSQPITGRLPISARIPRHPLGWGHTGVGTPGAEATAFHLWGRGPWGDAGHWVANRQHVLPPGPATSTSAGAGV